MSIRDQHGRAHKAAGSPKSSGGQFERAGTPEAAVTLGSEPVDERPILERIYDDEYRMVGHTPGAGDILMAIEDERRGYRSPDDESVAYLDFARREGFYDELAALIPEGDRDPDADRQQWHEQLAAAAQIAEDRDRTPDVVGGGTAEVGYMGGAKFTGSMYEGATFIPQTEVNKLVRQDLKRAQEDGYLPPAARFSVTKQRGLSSVNVRVTGIPKALLWHPGDAYDSQDHRLSGRTKYGREIEERLSRVAGAYGHSDVNSQVDYFNTYRDASITFDSEGA